MMGARPNEGSTGESTRAVLVCRPKTIVDGDDRSMRLRGEGRLITSPHTLQVPQQSPPRYRRPPVGKNFLISNELGRWQMRSFVATRYKLERHRRCGLRLKRPQRIIVRRHESKGEGTNRGSVTSLASSGDLGLEPRWRGQARILDSPPSSTSCYVP